MMEDPVQEELWLQANEPTEMDLCISTKEEETLEDLLRRMEEIKALAAEGGIDWVLPKVDDLYSTMHAASMFNKFLKVS
jgi:hypothetical protein